MTIKDVEYPSAPQEDGSAPRSEHRMVQKVGQVWHDVACGRCRQNLEPVFPDTVDDEGTWTSLQADGALSIQLGGGYGMYVDPGTIRPQEDGAELLLCQGCATWLRTEVPGVDLVIRRLEWR